jgi:hypothetical protein
MLTPKNGFENSEVSFRVGSGTMTVKVKDITYELIERVRHHADLSYYVEEDIEVPEPYFELQTEYIPEEHDIETVMQEVIKKPRKKKK